MYITYKYTVFLWGKPEGKAYLKRSNPRLEDITKVTTLIWLTTGSKFRVLSKP